MICNENSLFSVIVSIVFYYCCLAFSVIVSVIIRFMWKVYAGSFGSSGCLDVKCMVVSVCVVFLLIPKFKLFLCL